MSDELNSKLNNIEAGGSFAGTALLRDILIPELLSKDTGPILYWAGKAVARKIPLETLEAVQDFFVLTSLGDLSLSKQKHNQYIFTLTGTTVEERLKLTDTPDFQFETGFLAQSLEYQLGIVVEGMSELTKKQNGAKITLQTDPKEIIENLRA
ncbi:YslB family protein [Agrilactobacillus yilanensis]|uniref:YslB family protein n=1 Tax=Agrilactobacillus yilanensis TaxID=2485997 RepID=A0ABW4J712_9LACO|nr:YslB family protein [Agrilactobacillus yilanensis]